jgi:3-deoxy-D-manno-octulosonate 8-phosphate phosphatase (KDO 8-P phosphatase)
MTDGARALAARDGLARGNPRGPTPRCPADARARAARIALVLTDNDGVLTDGTVVVSPSGEHAKVYSVRDGMGVERLRERGIATGVVTREPPALIAPRAHKLALPYLWTLVRDKRAHLGRIVDEAAVSIDQLVYIGDDLNDLELLETIGEVGLTAAPADAMPRVRDAVHYVCDAPGGRGAFREVAEWLLDLRGQPSLEVSHAKRDPDR